MAIYLGSSEKLKLNVDGVTCYVNLFSETSAINGIKLLSFDGYLLKDSNGVYLIAKEDE